MCAILNEIIAIGGTTAYEEPFDTDSMIANYIAAPLLISCTVADLDGAVVGFQAIWQPDGSVPMPPDWAVIASFVKVGITGQGIGRALFTATCAAARAHGVVTIDARIRADNASGLRFYSAMGFKDHAVVRDVPLNDGRLVDRIHKRFDL
jgi:L-amino acid N-acyltransferase YncA